MTDDDPKSDMNPMIDTVFLLIIFFLCINFRVLEAKLPAYLPKDRGSSHRPEAPVERLELAIVCKNVGSPRPRANERGRIVLDGHTVGYRLGTAAYSDLSEVRRALEAIAAKPDLRIPDNDRPGRDKLSPVQIKPGRGTTFADVASCLDTVIATGFDEVEFGPGSGKHPEFAKMFEPR